MHLSRPMNSPLKKVRQGGGKVGEKQSSTSMNERVRDTVLARHSAYARFVQAGFENTRIGIEMSRWAVKTLLRIEDPFDGRKRALVVARDSLNEDINDIRSNVEALPNDNEVVEEGTLVILGKTAAYIELVAASGQPQSSDFIEISRFNLRRGGINLDHEQLLDRLEALRQSPEIPSGSPLSPEESASLQRLVAAQAQAQTTTEMIQAGIPGDAS